MRGSILQLWIMTSHELIDRLREVLRDFETTASDGDTRTRVRALVPAFDALRELGKSVVPKGLSLSARERLLAYFLAYPRTVLEEKELALVAGISEWARRVRELRVEFGWKIITGMTAKSMLEESELSTNDIDLYYLGPKDYVLLDTTQDRDAAHRWNLANAIRKAGGGSRDKILRYLRGNVGRAVTGEELRYVAQSSEWARRARELRTEEGWPISTKMSGNPSLAVGEYVLEEDRQAPSHDRKIQDSTRRAALLRDGYQCQRCGWSHDLWNASDPRFLELHHVVHHVEGGSNEIDNLITYCNVCHDEIHKLDKGG